MQYVFSRKIFRALIVRKQSENASSRIPKQFLAAGDSLGDLKTDLQRELASREME